MAKTQQGLVKLYLFIVKHKVIFMNTIKTIDFLIRN